MPGLRDLLPQPAMERSHFPALEHFCRCDEVVRQTARNSELERLDQPSGRKVIGDDDTLTERDALAGHGRLGKEPDVAESVLALAVRWVLDQGPTIALWGARNPQQLDPLGKIEGWHLDEDARAGIESILEHCMRDPVSPEFMAPPERSQTGDPGLPREPGVYGT